MLIASAAGAPPPAWLDTLGNIAGVILTLELIVVLLIVCGLIIGMVVGLRWLNIHIIPVLQDNAPKARQVMQLTETNTNRAVNGIAEFYGRRQAVRTGIRVMLFGKQSARRLHEDSLVQAATDLDLMQPEPSSALLTAPAATQDDLQADAPDRRNGHHAPNGGGNAG